MPNPNVGLGAAIAETTYCIVMDTYLGKCPTGKEFNNWADGVNPDCVCTNAKPPVCRVVNAFLDACPANSKQCTCNAAAGSAASLRNPVTGAVLSSGGGSGCTTKPCTACDANDGEWHSNGTGYEVKRSGGTCSGNSCTSNGSCSGAKVEYRCAAGYCGTTTDGKTGCSAIAGLPINQCFMLTRGLDTCPDGALRCICTKTPTAIDRDCMGTYNYYPGLASNLAKIYCATYAPYTTGYEKGAGFVVESDGMCTVKTELYRCAAGFYGQATDSATGCAQCPAPGTSEAGTLDQGGCYITSGTDSSGAYNFNGEKCFY